MDITDQLLVQQAVADLDGLCKASDPWYGGVLEATLEGKPITAWPEWVWPSLLECDNSDYWRGISVKYNVNKL